MAREPSKNRQPGKAMSGGSATGSVPEARSKQQIASRASRPFRAELLFAGAVFLVALFLYSWTLAPAVTLTVAHGLGVAHPPGFPLWVVLAHLASLVPFGNVAVRINFASALFAALASAMLTLVVAELMIAASYLAASKRKKKGAQHKKKAAPYTTRGAKDEDSATGRLFGTCACAWRGPAHGVLPDALVLCDHRRGLYSQHTAHPRYLLSDASVAAVHHGRQKAYRQGRGDRQERRSMTIFFMPLRLYSGSR
jgi:hypothetical protein